MPLPRPQSRARAAACRDGSSRGFTLIELLAVIAIIGVLSALTFGVVRGVRERSRASQARSELAVLAAALEAFKRQYGDYPQTGNFTPLDPEPLGGPTDPFEDEDNPQAFLFNALIGKFGPKPASGTSAGAPMELTGGAKDGHAANRSFVEAGKLRVEVSSRKPAAQSADTTLLRSFLDPWGRRYQYFYKRVTAPTTWEQPGYILYSVGPDGLHERPDPATGAYEDGSATAHADDAERFNPDNIFAQR